MYLNAPAIWTPRMGPWWRLPAFFTAGKQQRASSGKAKHNPSTGKLRRNTASITTCCCTPPAVACASCTVRTPATWTLVASGVTRCGCCPVTGGSIGIEDGGDVSIPNGTYILTQNPLDPCQWGATITGMTTRGYTDGGCTVADTVIDTLWGWGVRFVTGNLFVELRASSGSSSRGFEYLSASNTCNNVLSGSNLITLSDCPSGAACVGSGVVRLYGGTVTVTPNA